MERNNKVIAKGVVTQLLLEEKKYKDNIPNTAEYKAFKVEDAVTAKLDLLDIEAVEINTKLEKLKKEIQKLELRNSEIVKETFTTANPNTDSSYYRYYEKTPSEAKQHYIYSKTQDHFYSHDWYPDYDTLLNLTKAQLEAGNFTTFDEVVTFIRTTYQK